MKYLFIINPISGNGSAVRFLPIIDRYFKIHPADYDVVITEYPRHAEEIASKITEKDDTLIVSVGGDGTANEVLNGLQPGVKMCILPAGTGNDFYKSVDTRKLKDEQIFRVLMEGEDVPIDYGIFNDGRKFMNVASFGIDADINVYACDYVKVKYNLPGSLVYAYSALKVGTHPKEFNMKMTVDGKTINRTPVLVALMNGKAYGGCFRAAPQARLDDGWFDICVINGPVSTARFFKLIAGYLNGTHIVEKEVETLHGKDITIEFEKGINLQVDGENTNLQQAHFKLVPGGVTVRMPAERRVK